MLSFLDVRILHLVQGGVIVEILFDDLSVYTGLHEGTPQQTS